LAAALTFGSPAQAALGIRLPQPAHFPAIRFQRIATNRLYTMSGRNTLCEARVQHDCWANDSVDAADLADLLIRALDTFTLLGTGARPNFVINQWLIDEPEPEPVLWRAVVDAKIYFLDSA
jgi:hypothetical protein